MSEGRTCYDHSPLTKKKHIKGAFIIACGWRRSFQKYINCMSFFRIKMTTFPGKAAPVFFCGCDYEKSESGKGYAHVHAAAAGGCHISL